MKRIQPSHFFYTVSCHDRYHCYLSIPIAITLIFFLIADLCLVSKVNAKEFDRSLFEKISQGVAGVSCVRTSPSDLLSPLSAKGIGSGFLIDMKGHIVTSSALISQGKTIEINLNNNETWPASIKGIDPITGIAIVKIEAPDEYIKNLLPIALSPEQKLSYGEEIFSAGRLADGNIILTSGIVACPQRSIKSSSGVIYDSIIQNDINIMPGMIGGPLIDSRGTVIGMNINVSNRPEFNNGAGFAIPSDIIYWIYRQIIEKGVVERAWFGASFASINSYLARSLELPVTKGIMVTDVVPSGPAAIAGIKGSSKDIRIGNRKLPVNGDIVVAVNKTEINCYNDLLRLFRKYEPGKRVLVSLYRGERIRKLWVTLGKIGPDGRGKLN